MIVVQVSLDLTAALLKTTRLAGRFSDFTPVLGGRVDVAARRLIRRMFETQGRASGQGQWPALSQSYLPRREFPRRPMLRQTDALYNALTKRGHPDQEIVLEPDLYSLTVAEGATDDRGRSIRARFIGHQTGNNPPLPQRQMIPDPLPGTFLDEVRRLIKAYVLLGKT